MERDQSDSVIDTLPDNSQTALNALDSYWAEVERLPVPDTIPSIGLGLFPEDHRIDMFHLARDAWVSRFDPQALVTELREGVTGHQQRKDLKDLRKHGLILRTAYRSLDGRHLAPENHWLFTKLLGELNDGYNTPHKTEAAERLAAFVDERYSSVEGLDFFPASDLSFKQNYSKDLDSINTFNREESLPAGDFHLMRKLLRNTMNTFRLSGTITNDPVMAERSRYMQNLNDILGAKQDQLVQQDLHGDIVYDEASVVIPRSVKGRIQGFVDAHQ